MTQIMKFTDSNFSIDFSEVFDDKTIRVNMYGNGHQCKVFFDEQNLKKLKGWVNKCLREIKQIENHKK